MIWTTAFIFPLGVILGMVLSNFFLAKGETKNYDWLNLFSIHSPESLKIGLFFALTYSFLLGGGLACVQHLCLRFVLWRSSIIPWNFAQFLNYCVERRLLLRVGGRYRFLHRELLDYFAQCDPNVRK